MGLFFSLGHSTVVFLLLLALVTAAIGQALLGAQGGIGTFGGWVGPFVVGIYLITAARIARITTKRAERITRPAPQLPESLSPRSASTRPG